MALSTCKALRPLSYGWPNFSYASYGFSMAFLLSCILATLPVNPLWLLYGSLISWLLCFVLFLFL